MLGWLAISLGTTQLGDVRFRLLETTRAYALIKLKESADAESGDFAILQIEFPDMVQKFLVLQDLFPDNLLRELREKSLQHSAFLHRTRLGGPQNRKIPCKIP